MGMLLGTYLSRPVTTKCSFDDEDDRMAFGSSSMQGWRETQEDAHNCILDFDPGASFFAVYDGHGGSEVSEYAAQTLPDFLKSNNFYKQGEYEKALKDSFLKFDRSLKTPPVVKLLHKLSRFARRFAQKDAGEASLKSLKEEALMPLEEVLAKYALARMQYQKSKHSQAHETNDIDSPSSSKENRCGEVNSIDSECSSSKSNNVSVSESESEVSSSSSFRAVQKKSLSENYNNNGKVDKTLDSTSNCLEASNSSGCSRNVSGNDTSNNESNVSEGNVQPESSKASRSEKPADSPSCSKSVENKDINVRCNGQSDDIQSDEVISSSIGNGEVDVPKSSGKGKSLVKYQPKKTGDEKKHESSESLFHKFLFSDIDDDSSESDSDDATFTGPDSQSDDDDDDDDDDDEEEDAEEEEEEEDNEGEEEEGENKDKDKDKVEVKVEKKAEEDEDEDQAMAEVENQSKKKRKGIKHRFEEGDEEYVEEYDEALDGPCGDVGNEEKETDSDRAFLAPGSDSGCTALVAFIKDKRLYVANAGDCRCVVSKNGEAIELSLDHKPENDIELRRIERAGGRVHGGRVNDGLNLSRALGDHVYKRTPGLPPEEQMISPMPDIQILDLDPDIEFMILACDGIWNSMSSKEVVDFVRPKLLSRTEGISKICEELFDHCLAPDTICDGTGCDNMTAIIIQFKQARVFSSKKRHIEENEAEEAPKKYKTEDVTSTDSIDSSQPCESFLEKPSNSPDTTQ